MSVIIRLQNLAWSANALDIRQFFRGLSIPEGGVHIVGGELGDAFIAFSTDEDARQAMMQDGGKIKEMKIKLLLSSRTEMQKVIEAARQQTLSLQSFMQAAPVTVTQALPNAIPKLLTPEATKKDDKPAQDSETSGGKTEKKERRDRSRSRERSRSRDRHDRDRRSERDRGRDGGRRRHERSRSRDRDRERDRDRRDRDRRRRRDRSRSRDRTKSRDRDSKRPNSDGGRRKDSAEEEASDVVCVGQFANEKNTKKAGNLVQNGVWEVPPQTQMQMLASGILGNNIGALTQESSSSLGQFAINGLNGIGGLIQSGNVALGLQGGLGNSSMQGLGDVRNRDGRNREPWGEHRDRMDQMRFPRGTGPFGPQEGSYGATGNGFRGNVRGSNPFLNKVQELDSRRNPHAFQSGGSHFKSFDPLERSNAHGNSRYSRDGGKSSGTCVEVRNMPLSATYTDIRHAFQGLYIRKDGLKIINDTQGNRVGIAYVKFAKPDSKEQAINCNRYVRGSEVEVLHLDESIFEKAVDSFSPTDKDKDDDNFDSKELDEKDSNSSSIVLEGLPPYAKIVDVAKLFGDRKIDDLFIMVKKDDHSSKMKIAAYVQFATPEDVSSVAGANFKIGPKVVSPRRISTKNFDKMKKEHERSTEREHESDCIIMRGLPFQTMDRDILDFFSDIGIVPHRIHMMLNQMGKPTGECFCDFDSTEEAKRAIGKNGLPFGKNTPTIELIPREKMLETLGMVDAANVDGSSSHMALHHGPMPPHYPPLMDQRPRFPGPMHHPPRFGAGFGPRGPPGFMGLPPRHPLSRHFPPMEYVEGFGKPGCVVSLENVPFKADIDEIITFFSDFNVKRENVIRRYNEIGKPTGDARVAFSSPVEAQRALRELRLCKMRDRTIFMKIA